MNDLSYLAEAMLTLVNKVFHVKNVVRPRNSYWPVLRYIHFIQINEVPLVMVAAENLIQLGYIQAA